MGKLGADVDQLDQLAVNLDRAATRLEGNASIIDGHTRALWWSGSTADRFAASWASVDRRHLSTIAASMREAAKRVRFDAQQQRSASASSGYGLLLIPPGEAVFIGAGIGGAGLSLNRLLEIGMDGLGVATDVVLTWLEYIEKFGPGFGDAIGYGTKFLAVAGIAYGLYDLFLERRDGNLGWLESTADILKIAAAATAFIPGVGWVAGAVLLSASLVIDAGLWMYDNWDRVTDVAADVGDAVIDAGKFLVAPYIDAAKGVVNVTESVVDTVGDAVGDGLEAVGDVLSAPGRLIASIF